MKMQNIRLVGILVAVVFLLLIPFVAMRFTSEVNWTLLDFVVMGILLLGVGFAGEFVIRKVKTTGQRIAFLAVIFVAFLLIWAELAVGIFGTPLAGS